MYSITKHPAPPSTRLGGTPSQAAGRVSMPTPVSRKQNSDMLACRIISVDCDSQYMCRPTSKARCGTTGKSRGATRSSSFAQAACEMTLRS